uniref:HAT C-terminal dimerisation domain-containing protein n=1 Tax=Octopus bimaculoides TaxID=37653 RepID=A0A0L8HAD3_OCTBM
MVFARYVHSDSFKEEFIFCSSLETITRASNILEKVSSFLESENLSWDNMSGCCIDGAPAMLGTKSGFQASVKKRASKVKDIHCMIHHQTIKIVNFVKGGALNSRFFRLLYTDIDAGHHLLLFHTNVRWLSRGSVTAREAGKLENVAMFETLRSVLVVDGEDQVLPQFSKIEILQHLTALENEFKRYFPELNDGKLDLVRNPFKLSVEKVPDDCQDEFLELKTDSGARDMFDEKSNTEFWPLMCRSYPNVAEKAIRALLPFVSSYLCESGFSDLTQRCTRLGVENDLRCALSSSHPRISELLKKKTITVFSLVTIFI